MFNLKREAPQPTPLALAIQLTAARFEDMDPSDEAATTTAQNIKTLCEAQATLWEAQKPNGVSKDVLVPVVGNLVGIISILGYERVNVITSKALSLLSKPKF